MVILTRYLSGFLNLIALASIFWYPYATIVASTTNRIEALVVIVPSFLMYSTFAFMLAYSFIKGMRVSKSISNIGFYLNSTALVIIFVVAAYARFTSSSQAQAGAAEFVRLLMPFFIILAINLFLIFKIIASFPNTDSGELNV